MGELNYFKEGWHHIISKSALDHQLFVLVLAALYTIKDWRQVLVLVTAFTIGHSITLALSTLRIVEVQRSVVEFLIPCTIVITAITNFFQKNFKPEKLHLNYFLALFFGLIHGLGFANTLRFILAEDENITWPLLQFNLGLEVGQIVVVTGILLLAYIFIYLIRCNRKYWVWLLSAIGFIVALKLTIERFPST
ncbi:MAG: HupE/UreJ family protein [Chitinophagaceae bacterium]|nr:HupE/UreJ family protein [Chitinophagaceae bacterium]